MDKGEPQQVSPFFIGKLIKYWDIIMIKVLPKTMEVH